MKMKLWIVVFISIIMTFSSYSSSLAQVGIFIDKDQRIANSQDSIFKYLIAEKQFSDTRKELKLRNYEDRFFIRKCLEIYLHNSQTSLLLISFGANSDHADHFWGLLGKDKNYLFYSLNDPDFMLLEKEFAPSTVDIIKFYCRNTAK
ncbi:hypothetical protein [Desertivirga brevis]|uniref:hypothetical protein n=1 Tax=Desertivirga brevis TaxID=2810310 RepID=UPI001A96FD4A|nr:hypothetical protein [Pedobacter sp. SYSU D00873]